MPDTPDTVADPAVAEPTPWVRNGVWTVVDQALFAGGNFAVNVMLARWLDPAGYGAYTVAYTVFLLLGTIHGGYLIEPMLVFGAGRFDSRLERYLRLVLGGHARFSVAFAALMAVGGGAAYVWGDPQLGFALIAFGVAQAAILFQWTMRSACFVRTQPVLASVSDGLYAVIMLGGVTALQMTGLLDVATAIALVAVASLIAGGVTAIRLKIPLAAETDAAFVRDASEQHRAYGTWASATGVLEWVNGYLPVLLLPLWAGLAATGGLRALLNLVLPVLHAVTSLVKLLVPVFVRAKTNDDRYRLARRVVLLMGTGALAWAVVIGTVGDEILSFVYDGKYDAFAQHLWLVALLPMAIVVANVTMALLRAEERPEAVFAARAVGGGAIATVGAWLTFAFGVAGALLADMVTVLVEATVMVWFVRRGSKPIPQSGALSVPGGDGAPRKHVLMVSFACGPGRGSEPGHGWQLVRGTARRYDVTAIVYSGFRPVIERELAERPVPGLRIIYHKLPFERKAHHAHGVDRTGWMEQLQYHAWQVSAGWLARRLERETPFALAHHVSFMRYWSPSAAAAVDAPFLWGPVGGGESAPHAFYDTFSGEGQWQERLRDAARVIVRRMPSVRRTARRATLGLAATAESAVAMREVGTDHVEVAVAAVALGSDTFDRLAALPAPDDGPIRFLSVGRLLHWKGYDLGMRAFARAVGDGGMEGAEYWVVGDGPERERLEQLSHELGVADRVTVWGRRPRQECFRMMSESHIMVHPSFHDSGGYATLEGMAAGRPVVCLDLGGPARQVTPNTGFAVDAVTPDQAEAELAAAFRLLAGDADLRHRLGAAGRERIRAHFTLPAMLDAMSAHYHRLWSGDLSSAASASPVGDAFAGSSPDAVGDTSDAASDLDAVADPPEVSWT